MLNAYEQRLMAFYLANAAAALHHRDREASDLAEWIADRENRMAFGSRKRRSPLRAGKVGRDEGMSGGKWRALHAALCEEYSVARKARPDRTAQRLRRLARATGLTRTDVDLLELTLRYQTQPVIESMIDDVFRSSRRFTPLNVQNPALPALLGVSANTVQGRLRGDAPLVRSGLVCIDSDGDLKALDRLNRLAAAPAGAGTDVHRLLLDAAPASELEWSDFDHVARDRDHVEQVITGALESGARGVNILLYGPPGTGKTEFCKVLAERLGVSLYSVGESDDTGDGDEPVRGERLQELRLAQRLLAGNGGSLLLFDEMEDLLSDPFPAWGLFGPHSCMAFRNTGSKVYMHRLLEAAPTPNLWTMNSTRGVSETILRRMMFALELRRPTPRVRARIWARELARRGIEAPSEDVLSLAREFEATPGVGAGATAAAGLAGGGIDAVRRGVRSLSRVPGCERPPQGPPPRFELGLIQADTDPVTLAECLVRDAGRGFSLCLQGPPGTGKSAFARYLAERLRLEVLHEARVRPSLALGRRDRAADRGRVRRGARRRGLSHHRRSRFALRRPAVRAPELGGEPGERDADVDGEPSPPLRVHHELRRAPRPRHLTAVRLQGAARLPRTGAGGGGVPGLVRAPAPRRRHRPCRLDPRGLRGGAPEGVVPRKTRRARSTRGHASRRVRREAGPPPPNRVPSVRTRGTRRKSAL